MEPAPERLDSWKEIAAYLGRTEKTARRWEQGEGMPVHRLFHQERGSVYGYKHELDAWRAARNGNGASPLTTTAPAADRKPVWMQKLTFAKPSPPTRTILPRSTGSPRRSWSWGASRKRWSSTGARAKPIRPGSKSIARAETGTCFRPSRTSQSQYQKALGTEPNHGLSRLFLGRAYLATDRLDQAVVEFERADQVMGHVPFSAGSLGHALARAGKHAEAERLLAGMMTTLEQGYYPAFAVAWIHIGLGNREQALDWTERAIDERLAGYYLPSVDPVYDPLRLEPRFQQLLARMNLPDLTASRAKSRDSVFTWRRRR